MTIVLTLLQQLIIINIIINMAVIKLLSLVSGSSSPEKLLGLLISNLNIFNRQTENVPLLPEANRSTVP